MNKKTKILLLAVLLGIAFVLQVVFIPASYRLVHDWYIGRGISERDSDGLASGAASLGISLTFLGFILLIAQALLHPSENK